SERAASGPSCAPHSGQNTTPCRACITNSPQTTHSSEAPRSNAENSWSSVCANENRFPVSELTENPDDLSEDLDVVDVDRLQRGVLGPEPDPVALAVERLDSRLVGRLVVSGEHRDDVAVPRLLRLLDDHEVAVEDAGLDHRLAANPQQEVASGRAREGHV